MLRIYQSSNRQSRSLRWLVVIALTLALLFVLADSALAAEFRTGDNVTIAAGEVVDDDLVLSGAKIVVDGTVKGDLIAVGGEITINGAVDGSLLVGAQALTVNGRVAGSLYNGGAVLTLGPQALIERNLFFGGYSFEARPGSLIKRDSALGAYQATLRGEIQRDVLASLAALDLNGKVGGDVNANVGSPQEGAMPPFWMAFSGQQMPTALTPGLRVGSDAQIGGQLNYSSQAEQAAAITGKAAGGVHFTLAPTTSATTTGATSTGATTTVTHIATTPQQATLSWLWARLREFVSLLVLGGLALWLMPKLYMRVVDRAEAAPLAATGWGLVVTIIGYIVALLLLVLVIAVTAGLGRLTLGGLASSFFFTGFTGLGAAFTLFTLLIAYGSKLVVIYPVGRWLIERLSAAQNERRFWALLLGALIYVLIAGLPYIGFIVGLIVTLIGIGAMWMILRDRPTPAAIAPRMVLQPA